MSVVGVVLLRGDGWPLCPVCGEDELADLVNTYARDDGPLFCYRCARVTLNGGVPTAAARRGGGVTP